MSERHLPVADATLNSHMALYVAKHRRVRKMSTPTREMGRFPDGIWRDLGVIVTMGRASS